ncbi:DUF4221 family protein [Algoriphagus hitonicola]|uniref:TolB-like 6-blade propeller-like n=1 Tax=Algoriphagus hitonicola TaxID=435880 RepID=A0A1I2QWF5_9BACT|nr:DUF4221 family protein [Algoriphagus hitonicola]SFG29956.1 protein of unknown function [Algoriphagus hitonicola]
MRNLKTILFLAILASCQNKKSENPEIEKEITFTIDTVMIDSKGSFLYLSEALGRSYLANDGKTVYNLNQKLPRLEVIDLSKLELVDTIPMEREGPAGIGTSNIYDGIQVLENGEVFIFAWMEIVRLSADRKSVKKFRFNPENLNGDPLGADEAVRYEGLISEDGSRFFTFYGKSDEPSSRLGLAIIDLDEMSLKKVGLPLFEELLPYEIKTAKEPNAKYPYVYVEQIYLTEFENHLLVSASPFNEVYTLDLDSYTYQKLTFNSSLTEDRATVNYPTEASSSAGTTESVWDRWKKISFHKMNWDEKTERFWRISYRVFMSYDNDYSNETYLTFFDREFDQIGEIRLPDDWKIIGGKFITQGMYWQFINIDDEAAFIRLKPNF